MTIALIDADILVYRNAWASEKEASGIALARLRESFYGILETLKITEAKVYLTSTDKSNFRFLIYPQYKANRTQPKPVHYDLLRAELFDKYGAINVTGQEADDAIGIDNAILEDSVIVSIDKDLDQLPGKHYNFVKGILYTVTPEEGLKYFYQQLLSGDRTDNIPGLSGIGEKKAVKALAGLSTEQALFEVAKAMYQNEFSDDWESNLLLNGQLLKIRQKEREIWQLPDEGDSSAMDDSATDEVD